MIRITEVTELDTEIRFKAVLDGENLSGVGKWVIPESPIVPQRLWGLAIDNPRFEYKLTKIKQD